MSVIVVVNPKGGAGKSTLATNIAGFLAARGQPVRRGDADPQQPSSLWLSLRPATANPITPWPVDPDALVKPPKGAGHVVLDTPAGLTGKALKDVLKMADKVVVPLQASIFDMYATRGFLDALAQSRHAERLDVGIVGMRVDERTWRRSSSTPSSPRWIFRWRAPGATPKMTRIWPSVACRCLTSLPAAWNATWRSGRRSVNGWHRPSESTLPREPDEKY